MKAASRGRQKALVAGVVLATTAAVLGVVLLGGVASTSSGLRQPRGSAQAAGSTASNPAARLIDAAKAPQLPELTAATDWINTAPLTREALVGKVVWIDFWDASCINCRRTFPALRALTKAYGPNGFVMIGVHSPEFDFEKPAAYVKESADRLGVTWPVANDPQMAIWTTFGNQYWPAQYLVDRQGKVRFLHTGEGEDDVLESVIRTLLGTAGGPLPAPVAGAQAAPSPGAAPQVAGPAQGANITRERYLGAQRGQGSLAAGVIAAGRTVNRHDPTPAPTDTVALNGRYVGAADHVTGRPGSALDLTYRAADVYAVLRPDTTTCSVEVRLDGKPVPVDLRGPDLRAQGTLTVVDVSRDDLWHLLSGPAGEGVRSGVLTLAPRGCSAQLFTFTFGG
jgi:thiol-disulfide isomerase/thioredoxin